MSITPGMMASAVSAKRQFNWSRMTKAMTSRTTETAGETMASCINPVVVSTSPVIRDKIPPVFMSQTFGKGRRRRRSNNARRSASINRTFSNRCR